MKKIIFTILTGLFLSFTASAQDYTIMVYGTVVKASLNQIIPVPDQEVIITIDSSASGFTYQNSVYTDESGYYQDIISIPGQPGFLRVQTMTWDSCLSVYLYNSQYIVQGTTLTPMDFYLCAATPPECQASFYYYQADPADPYTYAFINQSVGDYTTTTWYFGDSIYSYEENPIHTFPGPGQYYVCLTISDGGDCNSTYCETLTIGENGNGCENYFVYSYVTPFTLTFDGFMYNGQEAMSYWWDFGDGTTGTGQTITHTFPEGQGNNGLFTVSLTTMVIDSIYDTCRFTSYQDIWLYNQPPCNAYFIYYPDSLNQLTIQFLDMSYDPNGVPPDSWFWTFGDSTTSTLQNPVHTYATEGYYNVCLTITDSAGMCTNTYCEEIYTGYTPPPTGCTAYYSYQQSDSLTLTFNGIIYIYNNGQSYPDSLSEFTWDFGDGTTGTGQTVTHTFQENPAGGYMVCLYTVTTLPDGSLCSATYCETIMLTTPTFSIYGYVILDNNQYADQAVVHLMTLDSLLQNVIEVQTVSLDSGGHYIFPEVEIYNAWIYYVQAELTQGSAWFGQYLPTYHLDALSWEEATPVYPVYNQPANIYMIPGTPAYSGSGIITGLVTNLGTRGVMNGVEVVLMDQSGNPLTYVRSDEQGLFTFDNLAFGTYIIHAELTGIHTTEAGVTLSTEQPQANIQVQVSGGEANIVFGVPEHQSYINKVSEVYPNPVSNTAKIDITVDKPVIMEISIFDLTGQQKNVHMLSLNAGTHTLAPDTGSLPTGLYLLRIKTAQGELICRKFMISQ